MPNQMRLIQQRKLPSGALAGKNRSKNAKCGWNARDNIRSRAVAGGSVGLETEEGVNAERQGKLATMM